MVFPIIGRWFFKKVDDKISQYIFVLVMMYLGAVCAEIAGIEAIIGAFLAGLALNRLIPHTSTLMNRIEFVGNAYFIPLFLISVGMLINFDAFIKDNETIKVAIVMTLVAITAKYLASLVSAKAFGFTKDEKMVMYGLSNAQAAATLAAVLVGYNIIIDETPTGEPIRLLSDSVLNGTILMILVTCTIASFVTQKAAKNLAIAEAANTAPEDGDFNERILIPVNQIDLADDLVQLGLTIKSKKNKEGLYALNVIDNDTPENEKLGKKIMEIAEKSAISADVQLHTLIRHDHSTINGITGIVKENGITDIVLGLTREKQLTSFYLGNLTHGLLTRTNATTIIYKPSQPISTIKKHLVIVPEHAEKEPGFPYWLLKMWNISRNTGAKLVFYGTSDSIEYIRSINAQHPVECSFVEFPDWNDFLIVARDLSPNDNLIIVFSRVGGISYLPTMERIPDYLAKYFSKNSFIIIYPDQPYLNGQAHNTINFRDSSMLGSIQKLDEIGHSIGRLFRGK